MLRDPGEAEDVVQEVFARLFLVSPSFDGRSSEATWLHRVVLNRSLNALRARSRRMTLRSSLPTPRTPEEHFASRQQANAFLEALAELTPRHRALVWLRDVEGLEYDEIAARLRIPSGTVKSGLNRARERLRERLERNAVPAIALQQAAR